MEKIKTRDEVLREINNCSVGIEKLSLVGNSKTIEAFKELFKQPGIVATRSYFAEINEDCFDNCIKLYGGADLLSIKYLWREVYLERSLYELVQNLIAGYNTGEAKQALQSVLNSLDNNSTVNKQN